MRDLTKISTRLSIAAGAALFVVGCSGAESTNAAANDLGGNIVFEEPANDASAMESAANATDLMPADNMADDADVGGEPGGNSLESNVTGM